MSTTSQSKNIFLRARSVPRWLKLAFQATVGLVFCLSWLVGVRPYNVLLSCVGLLSVVAAVGLTLRQRWALLLEALIFEFLAIVFGTLALRTIARDSSDLLNWGGALFQGIYIAFFLFCAAEFASRWRAGGRAGD